MRQTALVTALILALSATFASADILAYEGFAGTGYSAGDLDGQGSPPGVYAGFDGTESWVVDGDASSVDGWDYQAGGLSYGNLVVGGGNAYAWRNTNYNDTSGAEGDLASASPIDSMAQTELYFSALVNADDADSLNRLSVVWDHELGSNDRHIGFQIRGSNEVWALAGSENGGAGGPQDTGLTLAAGTNLIVVRATDKTDSGKDEVQLWLNPDPNSPGSANWSQSGMYALVLNNNGFGFDGFYIEEAFNTDPSADGVAAPQSAQVDELRFGETMQDVIPVPEPATLGLLAFGAAGLVLRRRR